MNKGTKIAVIGAGVVGLATAAYFLFFKSSTTQPQTSSAGSSSTPSTGTSSSTTTSQYPSKDQLLIAISPAYMPDLGGDYNNYKNSINANYNQDAGHFQFGDWSVTIDQVNPIRLKATKGSQVGYHQSSYTPSLSGLRGLPFGQMR